MAENVDTVSEVLMTDEFVGKYVKFSSKNLSILRLTA